MPISLPAHTVTVIDMILWAVGHTPFNATQVVARYHGRFRRQRARTSNELDTPPIQAAGRVPQGTNASCPTSPIEDDDSPLPSDARTFKNAHAA